MHRKVGEGKAMTSQQQASEALAIFQANRSAPREVLESLLSDFFSFPSLSEYERTLNLLTEEMSHD